MLDKLKTWCYTITRVSKQNKWYRNNKKINHNDMGGK